ncbi:MAG: O-antigen ligase family protein [Paucimonas sp.]|jgi:O-antigen ligase|nr:O-antigen ligase family protein [Paucimonas sp.]
MAADRLVMPDPLSRSNFAHRIGTALLFLFPALVLALRPVSGITEILIVLLALACARPLWLSRDEWFWPARWIVIAFIANLAIALMSMAWSGFDWSYVDYPLRAALSTASIGLVFLARPATRFLWPGLFIGTFLACAIAIYQRYVQELPRAEGAHMAIMFGDLAMAMGLAALAAIPVYARTRFALFPYLSFAAALTAAMLSSTRGAWLAAVLAILPIYLYGRRTGFSKLRWTAATAAVAAVVLYASPGSDISERIQQAGADIEQFQAGTADTSVGGRLEMWKGAWSLFTEHPWSGVGYRNFNAGLATLVERGEIDPAMVRYRHAHNDLLEALATTGMPGGLALFFLYAAPLVFFWRRTRLDGTRQPFAVAGLIVVLSYAICGLTQAMWAHHVGAAFYAVMVSGLAGLCLAGEEKNKMVAAQDLPSAPP